MKTACRKHPSQHLLYALALLAVTASTRLAPAQGPAITYQGRLDCAGAPANGSYDLQFTLYPTSSGGRAFAGPVTNLDTAVSNGLFMVLINFGPNVFTGGGQTGLTLPSAPTEAQIFRNWLRASKSHPRRTPSWPRACLARWLKF